MHATKEAISKRSVGTGRIISELCAKRVTVARPLVQATREGLIIRSPGRIAVHGRSFTINCSHRDPESMDAMDPKQE